MKIFAVDPVRGQQPRNHVDTGRVVGLDTKNDLGGQEKRRKERMNEAHNAFVVLAVKARTHGAVTKASDLEQYLVMSEILDRGFEVIHRKVKHDSRNQPIPDADTV